MRGCHRSWLLVEDERWGGLNPHLLLSTFASRSPSLSILLALGRRSDLR